MDDDNDLAYRFKSYLEDDYSINMQQSCFLSKYNL